MHALHEYLSAWHCFSWPHANCAHFALGFAAPRALAGVPMPESAEGMRAGGVRRPSAPGAGKCGELGRAGFSAG